MSIISNIKDFFAQMLLKKELQKVSRKRMPAGFGQIRTVGILYIVPEEQEYPVITDFVRFFQENNKVVKALGYTNKDYVPHYCFPKLTYDYFSKKNVNWLGKPANKFVTDFIANDFDLMIDLNTIENFTLSYIGYMNQARFKVGMMNDTNLKHYDLMMHVNENIPLKEYTEQIIHYLTNLNISSNEQKA